MSGGNKVVSRFSSYCPSVPFEVLLAWRNWMHRPPFVLIVDSLLLTGCFIWLLGSFQGLSRPSAGQVSYTVAMGQVLTFELPEQGFPGRRMGVGTR